MANFLLRRFLSTLLVMLGISFVVFMIVHLVPGDPVRIMLGLQADQAKVEEIRQLMGLTARSWCNILIGSQVLCKVILAKAISPGKKFLKPLHNVCPRLFHWRLQPC
jgi:ABC-type microcin C transport system permease subunit YejB